jgi:hypothetical protein
MFVGRNAITTIKNRIFADFLMPSRLRKFEQLLKFALENKYQTYSIIQFWRITEGGNKLPPGNILLLRHDVDTDSTTAEKMWNIENTLGVKSTYFFRLSTLDIQLMKRIEESGSEATYHYEELSTICKRDRIRSSQEIQNSLPKMRELFARNIKQLRERTGLPMRSVASHGDFINRKMGIRNVIIMQDMSFRKEVDIDVEAYDESAMKLVESRFSDKPYPIFWAPFDPMLAIKNNVKVVYILVHPRHWRTAVIENFADDVQRFYEQIKYSI